MGAGGAGVVMGVGAGVDGGCGGAVTQPAMRIAAATAHGERRSRNAMAWIFLEALVALLIAIIIVWWTMGPKKRKPPQAGADDRDGGRR